MLTCAVAFVAGCGNSDSETGGAYMASGGLPDAEQERVTQPLASSAENVPAAAPEPDEPFASQASQASPPPTTVTPSGGSQVGSNQPSSEVPSPNPGAQDKSLPFKIAGSDPAPATQLAPDLSPAKLIKLLSDADHQMQLIFSQRAGIEDPQEARDTLLQIVKVKLEASRRLAASPDSTPSQKSEGGRGELQALSHLASLGDVQVAKDLEKLATANLSSNDPGLVSDSQLVLIGFALEALQNGDEEAPNRIVEYFQQIKSGPTKPGVPAMMIMGQARQALIAYGHEESAMEIRQMIIDLFANSEEPEIARMAAQIAGNVHFDEIEEQRAALMNGESITVDQWRDSVVRLVQESADMQTVQYLAGSALEFEGQNGMDEFVESTYDVLKDKFSDAKSATGREVNLAAAAMQARKDVIGRAFDPDLPKTDGSPLPMKNYVGKVVLMPFWATGFPDSLQLVPRLKAIRDANPDQVEIVGINLDVEGTSVEDFLRENDLGFPSLRAESSPTAEVANQVAASFGMVSLPFVAILDADGKVAALNFTGRDLEKTVNDLLQP
ncbi:MAG: thioredoxin-like domain-containing protein [Rubripirellula sp.]